MNIYLATIDTKYWDDGILICRAENTEQATKILRDNSAEGEVLIIPGACSEGSPGIIDADEAT